MSQAKAHRPAEPAFVPALILYGLDEANKPHAAVFAEPDVAQATKAASLMRFVALAVTTDACRELALGLPRGKIFASGRSFAPFVKKVTHNALKALGGEVPPAPEPLPADPFAAMVASAVPAASWTSLAAGQLVLAPEEPAAGGGWWPAVITELRPEDLAVLRWRDWPDLAAFPRQVADLALLHADAGLEMTTADDGEPGDADSDDGTAASGGSSATDADRPMAEAAS